MDLRRLAISHFRNFGRVQEVELPAGGLLVAAAPNATGKTNFLESVVVLLRGKSWRAKTEDCVAWGYNSFLIQGVFSQADEVEKHVAVRYHHPTKKLRIEEDGLPASIVGLYSSYPFVLFLPEDTFLLTRGPAGRRSFLNHVLIAHRQYVSALVQYHRVLRQRNSLLKRASRELEVHSWTELLGEHGQVLWSYRESLVTFFDDKLGEVYQKLSGEKLGLRVDLRHGAREKDSLAENLARLFEEERRVGHTLYGPHRDDWQVLVDGHPAAVALSRGQTRTLTVALKILAHRYIEKATGERPLLLLDDVLSEMDEERGNALLENLPQTQTLITCTEVPGVLEGREDVYLLDLRELIDRAVRVRRKQVKPAQAEEKINVAVGE